MIVIIVGALVWGGPKWMAIKKHNQCAGRIDAKIRALIERRPATIIPQHWEKSVGWAVTANCNILCYKNTTYDAMRRFEEQLDEKLREDVDPATIEWIGDRLSETGLYGRSYMTNWRAQWKALQQPLEP